MSNDKTEERAAFEAWYANRNPKPVHENATWAHASKVDDWEVWQARAALASKPAQPVREPMWQPIETAPKDGRKLLLWWAGMSRVGRCAGVGAARDGGDWWQVPSLECAPTGRPTHWMPLPAAPGATAEPAPAREPMTDEQAEQIRLEVGFAGGASRFVEFTRAIERHHGITKE